MADTKLLASKTTAPAVSGGRSGAGSGVTGSKTSYSKKGPTAAAPNTDAGRLNPMNAGKSTFGLEGV